MSQTYLTGEKFLEEQLLPEDTLGITALYYLYEPTFQIRSTTLLWEI